MLADMRFTWFHFSICCCFVWVAGAGEVALKREEDEKYPTTCQVCRFLVEEIYLHMSKSKSHDVLQIGSEFQGTTKKVKYNKSELRLTEALEDGCQKMLEYKVHKDRPIRYAREESTTFKTLRGLKAKGVKVDLGIPDEMWDTADGEVYRMKAECERLVEKYEDQITTWYFKHSDKNLTQWLCGERVLPRNEQDCLSIEPSDTFPKDKGDEEDSEQKENKSKMKTSRKMKGDQGSNTKKREKKTSRKTKEKIHEDL